MTIELHIEELKAELNHCDPAERRQIEAVGATGGRSQPFFTSHEGRAAPSRLRRLIDGV